MTLFLANLGKQTTLCWSPVLLDSCDHPGQATLTAGSAAQSHAVTVAPPVLHLLGRIRLPSRQLLWQFSISSVASVEVEIEPKRCEW